MRSEYGHNLCWCCACICILVKLIPIVRNLTCIAANRCPGDDGWLGWILDPVVYGRIDGYCIRLMMDQCWVTWSRVGTTCIVSAFVFAWDCNMLGCLPVLQFFCWLLIMHINLCDCV